MPQLIGILLLIALVIALYLLYLYVLFYLSLILLPIGCLVFVGAVLFNYLKVIWTELIVGNGWNDSPTGSEPAFKQYYFRKAYRDYEQVVKKSWELNREASNWVIQTGVKIFQSAVIFTWPLGITFFLIAAIGAVTGVAAYIFFGLIHLALVAVIAVLAVSTAYLLRLIEYISMLWRRIFLVCPNSDCYKKIALPIYICPNCSKEHKSLIPGSYGIIRRKCECTAWLPTLFLFGRNDLPSLCPHEECRRPLPSRLGIDRNLHIPIVGGPAAGKTSFMIANLVELHSKVKKGVLGLIEFPEKRDQLNYEKARRDFQSGFIVDKTAAESPDAFLVRVNDGGGDKLLYIYDPAGEVYTNSETLGRQEFYSYTHGIIFLIDPFSLPQVVVDFKEELRLSEGQIKPSSEPPQEVYDRMIGTLRSFSKKNRKFNSIPFAIVVTKTDAFGIAEQFDADASFEENFQSVKEWLINNGESNLVRSIEHDFKNIGYFFCSSLGRLPDSSGTTPFTPQGVTNPLSWVVERYKLSFDNRNASAFVEEETTTPYAVKVGGEEYNGKFIASLWGMTTMILLICGIMFSVNVPEYWASMQQSRTISSSTPLPISTPVPKITAGTTAKTTTDVNLRAKSNASSSKVGLAERGSTVKVLQIASDAVWCEVKVIQHGRQKENPSSTDQGWIKVEFLTIY